MNSFESSLAPTILLCVAVVRHRRSSVPAKVHLGHSEAHLMSSLRRRVLALPAGKHIAGAVDGDFTLNAFGYVRLVNGVGLPESGPSTRTIDAQPLETTLCSMPRGCLHPRSFHVIGAKTM